MGCFVRTVIAAIAVFSLCLLSARAQEGGAHSPAAHKEITSAPQAVRELNGQGLDNLAVSWWRWLMSAPDNRDLLADNSGDLCDLGQKGDVWYLTGSYENDKITRRCTIPPGKYIFIPVADVMLWDNADGQDCSLLQSDVKTAMDTARDLYVEIDGRKLDNIGSYRASMRQCFTLPGETDIYASDGYWVLLKPLEKGRHIIRFGNKMGDNGETTENSAQNIEYQLIVE